MSRRSLVAFAAVGAFLGACGRSGGERGSRGEALIVDQAHSHGTPGFVFLPPIVKSSETGTLVGGLAPVVTIEEFDASSPGVRRVFATFDVTSGVRQTDVLDGGHYSVAWDTKSPAVDPRLTYRIRVAVRGYELGFADVDVVSSGSELRNVDTNEYVPLLDGRTLTVKFRIEEPALRCVDVTCVAQDQCHVAGACDPYTGACSNPPKADDTACDDGSACTRRDTCQAGRCEGRDPVTCVASDACHDAGVCDPGTGVCSDPAAPDGRACDDGNLCTRADKCLAGACVGTDPVVCSAADACHEAGVCISSTGLCTEPVRPDHSACDDGDACTLVDTCESGRCVGSSPVTCAALDQCHVAGTCNPATGSCSNPAKPDGAACSDGDACTRANACVSGACVGSDPVVCTALNACHVAGTCDPATGTCSNPAKPDGTPCDDGDACTLTDTCQSGSCASASRVVCAPADACHAAATCDPATGTCSSPASTCVCGNGRIDPGETCDDGNTVSGDGCSAACLDETTACRPRATPGISGVVRDLRIVGDLAYAAEAENGLAIYRLTTPTTLTPVGRYDTPGEAYSVAVSGGVAYVADGANGLEIVNVSDPAHPARLGHYHDTSDLGFGEKRYLQRIAALGTRIYVSYTSLYHGQGTWVIDATNPAAPVRTKTLAPFPTALAVADTHLYLGNQVTLQVYDLADPGQPVLQGVLNTYSTTVNALQVVGSIAYLGAGVGQQQLWTVDVSNPAAPKLLSAVTASAGQPEGIAVGGGYAYLIDQDDGLHVFSVSNPSAPTYVGARSPTFGRPSGGVWFANRLYLTAQGIEIVDVATPSTPARVGALSYPEWAIDAVGSGGLLYVADQQKGILVYDMAASGGPRFVGGLPLDIFIQAVALDGTTLYAAGSGLRVIDVTTPSAPALIGSFSAGSLIQSVAAAGGHVYLGLFQGSTMALVVADVSGGTVVERGRVALTGIPMALAVSGNLVHVAAHDACLVVVDASATPAKVGQYSGCRAVGVAAAGSTAYVYDLNARFLRILDVSTPASPKLLASYAGGSMTMGGNLLLDSSALYVSTDKLQAVDVSQPASPAGMSLPSEFAGPLAKAAGAIHMANGPRGVTTYRDLFGQCAATCGNSVVEFPEKCDDGNLVAGDGCSPTCQ